MWYAVGDISELTFYLCNGKKTQLYTHYFALLYEKLTLSTKISKTCVSEEPVRTFLWRSAALCLCTSNILVCIPTVVSQNLHLGLCHGFPVQGSFVGQWYYKNLIYLMRHTEIHWSRKCKSFSNKTVQNQLQYSQLLIWWGWSVFPPLPTDMRNGRDDLSENLSWFAISC